MPAEIKEFFHPPSCTFSYVVSDSATGNALVIDPVLDFDDKSGRTSTEVADQLADYVTGADLTVFWILETHAHADHITAAWYLKERLGGSIAIGEGIRTVQSTFRDIFDMGAEFATDGSQFDRLLSDGDSFEVGNLTARVVHTPGHTCDSVTYVIDNAAFVGDTLFMPDFGTARCDFPGGDAAELYQSVHKILSLPPETTLYMCHDYAPGGRDYLCQTTVADQIRDNVHLGDGITEQEFVSMRRERDSQLAVPNLLIPAIQINICAGCLPSPRANGIAYLNVPLNTL